MSDRPEWENLFKQAMMEMHTQEKSKEYDHHWSHFLFNTKVCSKCNECEHDWKKFSNGIRVCSKCDKFIENIPNFFHHSALSDEE